MRGLGGDVLAARGDEGGEGFRVDGGAGCKEAVVRGEGVFEGMIVGESCVEQVAWLIGVYEGFLQWGVGCGFVVVGGNGWLVWVCACRQVGQAVLLNRGECGVNWMKRSNSYLVSEGTTLIISTQ